jgi:hypothetical protein
MKTTLAATATLLLAACASQPPCPALAAAEHCAGPLPGVIECQTQID